MNRNIQIKQYKIAMINSCKKVLSKQTKLNNKMSLSQIDSTLISHS